MGNEALRSSRHSASSSSFRRSTRRSSKSGQNYIAEDEVDSGAKSGANMEIVAAQTSSAKPNRRLDKIRRSLSFRRKKKSKANGASSGSADVQQTTSNMTTSISAPLTINASAAVPALPSSASAAIVESAAAAAAAATTSKTAIKSASTSHVASADAAAGAASSKPALWAEDEKRVRANNCSFQVKYLGSIEVADSRGMHICELAIEKLLLEKKKPIKAILYVSGDSLRVVDELNKTLLVDQTIEKVSFCAPDRHHENGFAYICRDGTTRRWLCHGFMAAKETLKATPTGSSGGERLSHAVGCAFSVCLEKKQRRERENVSMEVGPNHSFTRLGSFRQASLTERLEDPQIVMPAAQPVPIRAVDNPHAIERPKPNLDNAFNRQNPLRATGALQMPFKRNAAAYSSLKPGELPSFQQQKISSGFGPTSNSASASKTALLMQSSQQAVTSPVSSANTFLRSDTSNKINTISELPEEQLDNSTNLTSSNPIPTTLTPTPAPPPMTTTDTSRLAEQLSSQLSVQTPVATATPLVPVQASPILQPTPAAAAAADPVLLQQQQQQLLAAQQQQLQMQQLAQLYQMQTPSIFATPQSIPVTPSGPATASSSNLTNEMLLAAAAASNAAQTPSIMPGATPMAFYSQTANGTPQLIQMMPVQYINGMQQPAVAMMAVPATGLFAAATPGGPLMPMAAAAAGMATPSTPMVGAGGGAASETFEQKWARIQAAKKTNPFAEDIAKKFEIKL